MKQSEKETSETLKLEKILIKLKALDIREWTIHNYSMSVKAGGIEFYLKRNSYEYYSLSARNIEDNIDLMEYNHNLNKTLGRMIKAFYEETYDKILDYKEKMFKERLEDFLKG